MARSLLGAGAGVLLALSVPPFGWWPLGLLGAALLAWALGGARVRARVVTGLLAGLAQFGIGLFWTTSFSVAGFVVLLVVEALFLAIACALVPRGSGSLLCFVGLLTLAEWARDSWPFGGLPLGGLALGQADGPLLSTARLGGPLLIVATTLLAGAGVAALLRGDGSRTAGAIALACAAALGAASSIAPRGGAVEGRLVAAIVQEGGRRGLDALEVPASSVLAAVFSASAPLTPNEVRLVLWPEDVVELGAGPLATAPATRAVGALARRLDATLLAGVTRPVGRTRFDNEMLAFGPSGRIVARFEKVHPVPFGEYVPFRSLIAHVANLSDIPRDAVRGHGSGMIATPAGRLALLVSFETFFTDRGRSGVRAGGKILLVSTNTASYASGQVPAQELAASRIQAVAEGRELLQSATTGYSAAISPSGVVTHRSRLGRPALTILDAPLYRDMTPYDRFGDLPVLLAAAALCLIGYARRLAPRRVSRR